MSAQLLIQTLKGFGDVLAGLRAILVPPADQLFVYYICPLTNLRQIATTGILPNATAPKNRTDLSGQSVQSRRDIDVLLTDWRSVKAHQCINLFWNPLNLTFQAFQRNGLLREASSKNPDDAIVCILEIDLERLMLDGRCEWTIAPQNLAGTGFATFNRDHFAGALTWEDGTPRCDWRSIFSVSPPGDRALNSKRSAELLVHLGDNAEGTSSIALPFDMVARIIIPSDDIRALSQDQELFLQTTGKPLTRMSTVNGIPVYLPREQLIRAEMKFLRSAGLRRKTDPAVFDKINAALEALERFETEHPELCPGRDMFKRIDLADAHHGSLHAVRVMFWSAFLAQHLDEETKQRLLPVVLVAASLHDTHREGSTEDETHGTLAAAAHHEKIEGIFKDPLSRASCLRAIRFHCIPDERCPEVDLALQIVKDADALDRGRFAGPGYQGGCETDFLRTEVLRSGDPHKNIAWMAHWVAQITRYSPFGSHPCADFSRSLCDAVNILSSK